MSEVITHHCPGCGKKYACGCSEEYKEHLEREHGGHREVLVCGLECADRLAALESWLHARGF